MPRSSMPSHSDSASSGAPSPMQPETPVLDPASPQLRPSPSARFALSQLFEAADPLAVLQQYPTSGRSLPSPRSARPDDATQPLRLQKRAEEEVDAPRSARLVVLDHLGLEGSPAQWASSKRDNSSPHSATVSGSEYSQASSRYSGGQDTGFPVDVDSGDEGLDITEQAPVNLATRRGAGIPLALVAPRQREQAVASEWAMFASSAFCSSAKSSTSGTDHRGAALRQLQREEVERGERAQRRANSPRQRELSVPSARSLRSGLNSPRSPVRSNAKDEEVASSVYLARPQPCDVPMSAGEANPYSPHGLPTPKLLLQRDPSATPLHELNSSQLPSVPSLAPAAHLDQARQHAPHSFHSRSASDSSDASSALTASEEAHAAHKAVGNSAVRLQKSSGSRSGAYLPPAATGTSVASHSSHASSATSASANASHAYKQPSSAAQPPNMRVLPAHLAVSTAHITGAPSPALLDFVPAQMAKVAARAAREAAAAAVASSSATPRAATPPQSQPEPSVGASTGNLSRALSYGRGRDPGAVPFAAMGKQGQLKPTWEQLNRQRERRTSRARSDSDGSANGLGYLSASESIGSGSQHREVAQELHKAAIAAATAAAAVETSPQLSGDSSGHSRSGSASSGASKLAASALRERRLRAKAGRAESLGEELPKEFKHELANIATDIPMPKRRPPKSAKRPGNEAATSTDQPTARAAVKPAALISSLQVDGREEVLASPAIETKVEAAQMIRRPSIESTASGASWESTSSRVSSMEEQRKPAAPAPASSGSSVYSDYTGTIQGVSRRESEANTVAAAQATARSRSGSGSSTHSDAHTVHLRAAGLGEATHPSRSNSRQGLVLRSRSRAHSRNGSTASSDSMSEGEAAILIARRFPAQNAPPMHAPPSPPQPTATAESYHAAAARSSIASHASSDSRAYNVDATPLHTRRPSLALLTGTGATRTTSADHVHSLDAPATPASRPGTAPTSNGIPPRPMRLRGATTDGVELHASKSTVAHGHVRNNSIDSDISAANSFISPSMHGSSVAGSHASSQMGSSSRFLNVAPAWNGYKHSNVSAESAASSLRWNNASEAGSSRSGSHLYNPSSSSGHAANLQPGHAPSREHGMPSYESSPQQAYGRHQLSGYGRPSTGSSDGRGASAVSQSRPTTASTTASHDGRLGTSRTALGLEDISPDHVSVSASWRAAPVSPAGSGVPSTYGGLGSRIGIQLTLNEEDIELHEEEPILTEQTSLFGVRRRLVSTYANLGGKWPSAITSARPKSSTKNSFDGPMEKPAWSLLVGSEKEMRKREEALEAREKELTIEAISKAEMATVAIEVWSEARKGRWIVKGPAQHGAIPAESLPDIIDPWSIPVDAKGIVRRRKLKSNIEMSSTRTTVRCKECNQARQARIGVLCHTCGDTGCVEMVYVVQCIVRLAQFTPLKLPAHHLLGARQANVKYLDAVDPAHRQAVLRDRAIDGLQAAAGRVGRQHYTQHGSRLLMGKATISRRGLLTVAVTNHKGKGRRVFEVEDGSDGKISEIDIKSGASEAVVPPPAAFNPPPSASSSFAPSDAGSTYGAYENSPHSPAPSTFAPLRPPAMPRRDRSYSGSSHSAYGSAGAHGVPEVNNYVQYGGGNRSTSPAPSRKTNKLRGFLTGAR